MNFETPEFICSICLNGKMQEDGKIKENLFFYLMEFFIVKYFLIMPIFILKLCDSIKKFLRARLKMLDAPKQCSTIEYLEKRASLYFCPIPWALQARLH